MNQHDFADMTSVRLNGSDTFSPTCSVKSGGSDLGDGFKDVYQTLGCRAVDRGRPVLVLRNQSGGP